MSKTRTPVQLLIAELAKFPQLDAQAELAVARQEGLSGRVGDNGTSFGPNQLHANGALPAWVWQRGPAFAQKWAWSPEGIDYALAGAAKAAGTSRGAAAVHRIVTNFERPADPAGEIQRALAAYGGRPAGGGSIATVPNAATPAASGASALDPLLLALYGNNLSTLGVSSSLTPLLALALGGDTTGAPAAAATSPSAPLPARTSGARFVTVPTSLATRDGIQLDSSVLPHVEQIASQFGVRINSGYRDPAHNQAVGGAQNSDHLRGDAVDFVGSPQQLASLYRYAQGRFPYVEPMSQAKDHVHISFRRP